MKSRLTTNPLHKGCLLCAATFWLFFCANVAAQTPTPTVLDRAQQVAGGLLPRFVEQSQLGKPRRLLDRMAEQNVPGLSIAVIDGGVIAWARGYGVHEAEGERSITPDSLFLAGSISKPVAATGALRLVQEGLLSLDLEVNQQLRSWQVPYPALAGDERVTLRRLLSHTAGLSVHGFPGYAKGKPIPSVPQILDGQAPANTGAVRIDLVPGSKWRYSGGGYTVMQLLVSDATSEPFAKVLSEKVLHPFGMSASTFQNPLPPSMHPLATVGHWVSGAPVPSRWHTYPEMAAAGLWTTASDLAHWAIGIQRAFTGSEASVLNRTMAREMLTEQLGSWGLGPSLSGAGDELRFSHGGRDAGFDAFLTAFAQRGQGVAILINANNNSGLLGELTESVAREYEWPGFGQEQRGYIELEPAKLECRAGAYEVDGEPFNLRVMRGKLFALSKQHGRLELMAESESTFFTARDGESLTFRSDKRFDWRQPDGTTVQGKRKKP